MTTTVRRSKGVKRINRTGRIKASEELEKPNSLTIFENLLIRVLIATYSHPAKIRFGHSVLLSSFWAAFCVEQLLNRPARCIFNLPRQKQPRAVPPARAAEKQKGKTTCVDFSKLVPPLLLTDEAFVDILLCCGVRRIFSRVAFAAKAAQGQADAFSATDRQQPLIYATAQ